MKAPFTDGKYLARNRENVVDSTTGPERQKEFKRMYLRDQ